MIWTPGRSARIVVATASMVALLVAATPPPASGWANAGDGYATHDWIVDRALDILDAAGRRPAWFDRDLALPYTDDPDTIERVLDPSRGWEHVYYDMTVHGGAVQRISEHYTAALDALKAGDTAAATINVALLSHFLSDIAQPYHTARAGFGQSSLHVAYESAVSARTRTIESAPQWADATQSVSAITNIRKTAAATASYSRARFADLHRAWAAATNIDDPTVTRITGEVLKRAARDLASVIWSLDRGTGRSPDIASLGAHVRWVGVRNGDPGQVAYATVKDADGNGIGGAEVQISWPLQDGTRKLYRTWTNSAGDAERTIAVGKLPMLRRQDVPLVAIVNGATLTRSRWFIPSPKLDVGRAGFKTAVNHATPNVGQTIRVTALARDTSGRPVPGLLVTWTWDIGRRTVRTSGITNAYGKAYSYRLITSSLTSGTVSIKAHVQSYSLDRYSYTSFNRN
ncbi:MAG: hypothetical protein ABJC39_04015 [Chloroflexota bacterium]